MHLPDRLTTPRLVVRPHARADLPAFTHFMLDEEMTRFMMFTDDQRTVDGAERMMDQVLASYRGDKPIVSLTIADRITDRYMGSCGLSPLADASGPEMFYTVTRKFQGQGFATEAIAALLRFAFEALGETAVFAHVLPANVASVRVAEKAGLRSIGVVSHREELMFRYRIERAEFEDQRTV